MRSTLLKRLRDGMIITVLALLVTSVAINAQSDSPTPDEDTLAMDSTLSAARTIDSSEAFTQDTMEISGEEEKIVLKETEDTVYVVKKSDMDKIAGEFHTKVREMRTKGFGAAGGPMTGLFAVSMRPVEDFIRIHGNLKQRDFGLNEFAVEPFALSGGMGYVGIGNGVRLGLAGMNGERNFSGSRSGDTLLVALRTEISYFGFLVQKNYVHEKMDLTVGAILGSGKMKVSFSDAGTYSAFEPVFGEEKLTHDIKARLGVLEVHTGFTYSFTRFVHVGGDISVPTFISLEGFGAFTDEFVTVNPGLRLKVMFGNLG